jgi:hypothetical protein
MINCIPFVTRQCKRALAIFAKNRLLRIVNKMWKINAALNDQAK